MGVIVPSGATSAVAGLMTTSRLASVRSDMATGASC